MFGNTAAVAEMIAQELTSGGWAVDLRQVAAAPRALEPGCDLLVLGAPTHAFSLSRASTRADAVRQGAAPADGGASGLREWLARVSGTPSARAVAVFDTRATSVRHLPGSAARKAARLARTAHLGPAAGTESFYVDDVKGPLVEGELERARAWARTLSAQVPTGPSS